jgi:hypothetical protein
MIAISATKIIALASAESAIALRQYSASKFEKIRGCTTSSAVAFVDSLCP